MNFTVIWRHLLGACELMGISYVRGKAVTIVLMILRNKRTKNFNVFLNVHHSIDLSKYQLNLLKPTGYVMHQQFNIQQLYALPTLYLCVLYLSQNKQRLVPLTSLTDWFL